MPSVTERNNRPAARAKFDTRTAARTTMPPLATAPRHFAPLAISAVGAQVAEHAALVERLTAARAEVTAHAATERAAIEADAVALRDALRAGKAAPSVDAHTAEWKTQRDNLARLLVGTADAVAASYLEMISAIRDQRADLLAANAAAADTARAELAAHLDAAASLVAQIDAAEAATAVVRAIETEGAQTRTIRALPSPVIAAGVLREPLSAADALSAVRDYRKPAAPVIPEPEVIDPGPALRRRSIGGPSREVGEIRAGGRR